MDIESKENFEIPDWVSKIEITPLVVLGEVFTVLLGEIGVNDFTIENNKIIISLQESKTLSDRAKRLIEMFKEINHKCEFLFY